MPGSDAPVVLSGAGDGELNVIKLVGAGSGDGGVSGVELDDAGDSEAGDAEVGVGVSCRVDRDGCE